jgi:hypothetical protein
VVRIVVEVKILPQITCKVLVVVFNRFIEVIRPCPFRRTLLRVPLAHSSFNLNSIRYTIVKIKT